MKKAKVIDNKKTNWWDEISEEERRSIEQGIAKADRGELIPHEEVMAKYKKWLQSLET